ncbi:MAG TPA: hypothetical protein VGF41_02855 [Myxococcaceae bacterium]
MAGLDNVTFVSEDQLLAVEDAGDGLHSSRKALDSGFLFEVNRDYSGGGLPIRFLAEGRDPSATLDSAFGGFGKNEGDNEITGIHVSDGDPSVNGILGAKVPRFGHRRLADVLDPAAWRQHHLGGHPGEARRQQRRRSRRLVGADAHGRCAGAHPGAAVRPRHSLLLHVPETAAWGGLSGRP